MTAHDSELNYSMTLKTNKLGGKSMNKKKDHHASLRKMQNIDEDNEFERDSESAGRGLLSGDNSNRNFTSGPSETLREVNFDLTKKQYGGQGF